MMATFSSGAAAGCSARKIRPRHGVMESMPSARQSDCLTRSAEMASSEGSSRTHSALVTARAGRVEGGAGFAPMTMNWPETLRRVAAASSTGVWATATAGRNSAKKKAKALMR